jgi:hypothetical protein
MRRSQLRLATAGVCLLGAIAWLAMGNVVSGLLWLAISAGWLLVAMLAARQSDPADPLPVRRLGRRFLRLVLFWT